MSENVFVGLDYLLQTYRREYELNSSHYRGLGTLIDPTVTAASWI